MYCLHRVFFAAHGLSLVAESGGYSGVVCGLLTLMASFFEEHRLQALELQ